MGQKRNRKPRFSFVNRDAPDYQPHYNSTYSERQLDIIEGYIELDDVRLNELSVLRNKAKYLNDWNTLETVENLYQKKITPDVYFPSYSIEEAKAILQRLTPWPINWGDADDS